MQRGSRRIFHDASKGDGGWAGGHDADAMEQKLGSVAGAPRSLDKGLSQAGRPTGASSERRMAERRMAETALVPASLGNAYASSERRVAGTPGNAYASFERRVAGTALVPASLGYRNFVDHSAAVPTLVPAGLGNEHIMDRNAAVLVLDHDAAALGAASGRPRLVARPGLDQPRPLERPEAAGSQGRQGPRHVHRRYYALGTVVQVVHEVPPTQGPQVAGAPRENPGTQGQACDRGAREAMGKNAMNI